MLALDQVASIGKVYLTGDGDSFRSTVTEAAEHSVVIELPDSEPSPGIRTYQASLLGLLLTAAFLSGTRQASAATPESVCRELVTLAGAVEATAQAVKQACGELADRLAAAAAMAFLGSGPSFGTAQFAAAKITEAAGVFAIGQDLEEWSHVERFAYPTDMPVVVVAPSGHSHSRAVALAEQAGALGRRVVAVTRQDDVALASHAVLGHVREEFSPLLYQVHAGYLASFLARRLGRHPFQADRAGNRAGKGGPSC